MNGIRRLNNVTIMALICVIVCSHNTTVTAQCDPNTGFLDPHAGWCPGDCDGNRMVAVNELVGLVGIALTQSSIGSCVAGDRNSNGTVEVNEIVAGVSAALGGCSPGVDMVLRNGKVFTADPDSPAAEAVAICGERFVAVGSNDDVRGLADAHTTIIDAGGCRVVPGFNDAHKHVTVTADLAYLGKNDPSLDAALASVAAQAQRAPSGQRIGALIGPTVLDDPRTSRFALDEVAPNHLALLEAFTGHGLVFNTHTMVQLGIAEDEPDPPGGFYVREPDSQILSGIAHEYAQLLINRQLAAQVSDGTAAGVYAVLDRVFARRGITSVQLMTTGQTTVAAARALQRANPSLRWHIIRVPMPTDPTWPLDDLTGVDRQPHSHVTISGLKYFLDGTPIERLAAMRVPYADRDGWSGRLNFPADEIERIVRGALDAGEQPIFHLGGDQAIATLLDVMESVASAETWRAIRPRFEHGDLLLPDLRERARNLGVIVVQNPIHFTSAAEFDGRFDAERRPLVSPLRSLLDDGIPLALGSDSPATPLDDLRFAVTHPGNASEAITLTEALMAHTTGSAYAEMAEKEKGQIRPGMLADIVVLSQDLTAVPPASWSNTESVLTMVGGHVIYRAAGF